MLTAVGGVPFLNASADRATLPNREKRPGGYPGRFVKQIGPAHVENTKPPRAVNRDARLTRYIGRQALRGVTTQRECFDCGRLFRLNESEGVGLRVADGSAGFSGLVTCGRIWYCPVCNSKVMARRALEVGVSLAWATGEQGASVIFGSLTCWHDRDSFLHELIDVQRAAWRYVVNSREWRSFDVTKTGNGTGRVGYVRASELNVGQNGYHPHFHPLIFARGTERRLQDFAGTVVARWVRGVARAGGTAKTNGAQMLRVIRPEVAFTELGQYIAKQTYDHAVEGLALEMVWSQGKTGRGRVKGTTSHWSILAQLATLEPGTRDYRLLAEQWAEIELAMHGHRMITWSRGLRSAAGLVEESLDEDVADEEHGTKEDTVAFITFDGWRRVSDSPQILTGILGALETGGWDACRYMLDRLGVEWSPVPEMSPV